MANVGGVTMSLVDCVFPGNGTVTHYLYNGHEQRQKELPNLYLVLIADNNYQPRTLPAGFAVKTSKTDADPDFLDALHGIAKESKHVSQWVKKDNISLIVSRAQVKNNQIVDENELVGSLVELHFKSSPGSTV